MSRTEEPTDIDEGVSEERFMPFSSFHPAVGALFGVEMLLLAMFAVQPVYACMGLVAAFLLSGVSRGWGRTFRQLAWQLPLIALLACANALFAGYGAIELLVLGPFHLKAESLAYGATMGVSLISVIIWFEDLAALVSQDELMALCGRRFPAIATMLAIAAQLVPQIMRRFSTVKATQLACTASKHPSPSQERMGLLAGGILLSWTLEDSIERSDAMRARGWGSGASRSSYRTLRFGARDAGACVALLALGILNAVLAGIASSQWSFYPVMPGLVWWWGYLPYAAEAALPLVSAAAESLAWWKEEHEGRRD